MNTGQLNLFDSISSDTPAIAAETLALENSAASHFSIGDRVQIIKAGPPLEHMNGHIGQVIRLMSDVVSVQIEGIAVALMFCQKALKKWTPASEYTSAREDAESVVLFRVGDRVECDSAFIGQVGIVQKIGTHCTVTVAWLDYGEGKPLYPSPLEHLSRIE